MRKLLWTLAALLGCIAVGLAVCLATFDADRYRPLILKHLEEALGRPVQLERVSLGLRHGAALELKGLAVFDSPPSSTSALKSEPALRVDVASAVVRLAPLLRRRVEVSSIVLVRPRIRLVRDARGRLNLFGVAAAASPAAPARPSLSPGRPAGRPRASQTEAAVSFAIASVRIEDGSMHWTDATQYPPTDLWLRRLDVTARSVALGSPIDLELRGALGAEAPNVHLSGTLTPPAAAHPGSLERLRLSVERLPLEVVAPASEAGEPQLRGLLTLTAEGEVPSLDPAVLARAARASGRVQLSQAVILNLNILREVFSRLAMLPGLVERLQARLPVDYRAKLAAKDTVLAPIDAPATLADGALRFANFEVRTEALSILGVGAVGLDGTVRAPVRLRIEPAFSEAIIRSVNELQALTNAKGELELPGTLQGKLPHVLFVPDVQHVASRVIVNTAADLLGQFLDRALDRGENEPALSP
jgi:hypothetical protein